MTGQSAKHLILGTRKGLIRYERLNGSWHYVHESLPAQPVSYAFVDQRNETLWAALDHGHWGNKLQRSRDLGENWEEVPTPIYPEGTKRPDGGTASCTYLWYIAPGGAHEPNRLYFGTEPGGLFISDDGGDSWQLNETLWLHPSREFWFGGGRDQAGLCSIIVDPRDSQRITVGISVGGVYVSADGGLSWEGRNRGLNACYLPNPDAEYGHDPHFMLASPSNPDVLWQQNHCGIFRSEDGGQNWKDISQEETGAYFGFAIAVDESDERCAWVVPAVDAEYRIAVERRLRVCRTEDGGQSWQELTAGLPQEKSYDLIFRHALDVTGDTLAFGTTTGNLFVSEDRGDHWQCLSHHLPPIHSVRFF